MRDVGTIMKIWASVFAIWAGLMLTLAAFGPSLAASNPEGYFVENEHYFEQDVSGDGFVMAYQKVNTETLQLQNYMHGSGSIDAATLINSSQSKGKYYYYDEKTHAWIKVSPKEGEIHFEEQNEMTYAPKSFAYGTGWYAENPVVFNSKLKEKTDGKNYQDEVATSMDHQIEYASGFVKDIRVNLECVEAQEAGVAGHGMAEMEIEETVTEGTVHVGELIAGGEDYGWKKPLVEIDENYVGSFAIQKKMKICAEKEKNKNEKDWLSCCIGGYGEMEDDDKIWGEKEIFDCTCRDVAWGDSWTDKSREQPL
jgi:hypothetical protein